MLSLAAIAFVGLRPGMGQMEGWVQWNFVPFVDLARSLDQPSWVQQIAITNLVGNVLFFVPWGFMVALRFPGARWLALLATTAAVSLGVETSHVIAISGRIEDDRFLPEPPGPSRRWPGLLCAGRGHRAGRPGRSPCRA